MNRQTWLVAMVVAWVSGVTDAQVVDRDFFNRNGVALYNPEIGVVASGPLMMVRPVVSADRKYVTIAAAPQLTQVVRIENFPVARIGVEGLVGRARPAAVPPGRVGVDGRNELLVHHRSDNRQLVLNQYGVTWIAPP